jgi:hypothetical protein
MTRPDVADGDKPQNPQRSFTGGSAAAGSTSAYGREELSLRATPGRTGRPLWKS